MGRHRRPKIRNRKLVFGAIGVFVMLTSFVQLWFMMVILGLPSWLAYAIQTVISLELNFVLNYLITWGDRRSQTSFWRVLSLFHVTRVGIAIPLNQLLFVALVDWIGSVPFYVAQAVCITVTTVLNWLTGDKLVFKPKGDVKTIPSTPQEPQTDTHRQPIAEWPSVSVVIPVKNRPQATSRLVDSLLAQDYPGATEFILVGDRDDPTWNPLNQQISQGRIRAIEADIVSRGRDANAKRNIGLEAATGDVLVLTDSDIVAPPDWLATGVSLMHDTGHKVVAGDMISVSAGDRRFWDTYTDRNPYGSKTPRMDPEYVLTAQNFGQGRHKPPITASMFIDRRVYDDVGGLDADFVTPYEDYPFADVIVSAGHDILCTGRLSAYHSHREGFRDLTEEYWKAGQGCADYVARYKFSPLASKRAKQFKLMLGLYLAGVLALIGAPVLAILAPAAMLLGLGVLCWRKVKSPQAVLFPFVTAFLGTAFTCGMAYGVIRNDSRNREPTRVLQIHEKAPKGARA
jgi:succinoglycan biosynthesis protein ExoA